MLNMRTQTYADNYYDFSKVLEYACGGSNFSTGIISLETLIEKGFLPDYCFNLSGPCLLLLIHAIDREFNRSPLGKIDKLVAELEKGFKRLIKKWRNITKRLKKRN
ncbi:hypothetical protein J2Y73_000166 [Peribacillus frigoritolerans]|uniref:hypothetical protein n=1 Tax=Peribacillus frigoritolerans TaxID=450367 RepID=UPI00209FE7D4|nr:hypothetical protein [Peribacillus frigoritolerans]MCP1490135.1 hypothetical protein [Peribacillus frigoritolerans]